MDIPILKYLDVLIGFTLVMILAGTVVATITQLYAFLARCRGRYLLSSLELLLGQADTTHLQPVARKLAEAVLYHPLVGKPSRMVGALRWISARPWIAVALKALWTTVLRRQEGPQLGDRIRGSVIKREELVRVLLELAGGNSDLSTKLQQAFSMTGAQAETLRKDLEQEVLRLESEDPKEATHIRETKALVAAVAKSGVGEVLVARITGWFDHAMQRVTLSYAASAKIATAVAALIVAVVFQLDAFALLQRLAADEKMRTALVAQAVEQQKKIEEIEKQPAPAPAATPAAAPEAAAPADDLALLKKHKADLEASIADLSQPGLGILTPFYQAETTPAATPPALRFSLGVGTKVYQLQRAPGEGFSQVAARINSLGAGAVAHVERSGDKQYVLRVRALQPNVKTLELRTDPEGVNLLEPAALLHAQAAEASSGPLEKLEAGRYRLNLGRKTFELAVQEKQTVAELAKAINELNADVRARAADATGKCKDCVLVVTAVVPDFKQIKLLTDAGKTDLIRKTTVAGRRAEATTERIAFPAAREFQLAVGGRSYEPIKLGEKESFADLAARINSLKPGGDVRAAIQNASAEDCKECYVLTLAAEVPDIADIGLRRGLGGINLLGPVATYYSWANLAAAWKGIFLSWVLLSLGTPFWYDMLKNLLRLRPVLAHQEEKEREQRQTQQ